MAWGAAPKIDFSSERIKKNNERHVGSGSVGGVCNDRPIVFLNVCAPVMNNSARLSLKTWGVVPTNRFSPCMKTKRIKNQ